MQGKHLNEKDFYNIYYYPKGAAELSEHLDSCPDCKSRYENFANETGLITKDIHNEKISGLDERFFNTQTDKIISAIRSTKEKDEMSRQLFPKLVPVMATVLVMFLAITAGVIHFSKNGPSGQPIMAMSEEDIADDILLMEIEELKEMPSIDGLEIFVELNGEGTDINDEHGAVHLKKTIKV